MPGENLKIGVKCSRCFKEVPLAQVRLAKDGVSKVCAACFKEAAAAQRPVRNEVQMSQGDRALRSGARKFSCTACGYVFSQTKLLPKSCPYCGKKTVVEPSSVSSQSLIDSS
ncbi:MAG: hypothetical protein HC945_00865 [Nitrosarchaeum sp.]|nr:hypothetical protein [Nitrosarchaeum sp.]